MLIKLKIIISIVFLFLLFITNSIQAQKNQKLNSKNETVIFEDNFDNFIGWKYTFDNNERALFKVRDGVLSVADFGKQKGGGGSRGAWYGAIAVKDLIQPLDINRDDFILKTYFASQDNTEGALGFIWVVLIDDENTPLVGIYWSDCHHEGIGLSSFAVDDPVGNGEWNRNYCLGIYTNEAIKGGGFKAIDGKVTLSKANGQLALRYNRDEGKPDYTSNVGSQGTATKMKIYILKYGEYSARDMMVDYIKLIKR